MFLFNGKNNNLYACGNPVERRKLMTQEGEGKFYGAMPLRRYLEMEMGCRPPHPGAAGSGADTDGQVGGVVWGACGSSL